jgi:hypothetical protein
MPLTYLDSKMIEVPATIADLSAQSIRTTNLTAVNLVTPVLNNIQLWDSVYTTVVNNSASWEDSSDILPTTINYLSTNRVTISSVTVLNSLTTTNLVVLSSLNTLTTTNLTILSTTAPTLSTNSGVTGTLKWDADYLYICVATDTWKRVALSGWEG